MDLRFPQAEGKRPPGLSTLQWAFGNLIDLTSMSPKVCQVFYEVLTMRRGLSALASPGLVLSLLAYSAKSPFVPLASRVASGAMPPAPGV